MHAVYVTLWVLCPHLLATLQATAAERTPVEETTVKGGARRTPVVCIHGVHLKAREAHSRDLFHGSSGGAGVGADVQRSQLQESTTLHRCGRQATCGPRRVCLAAESSGRSWLHAPPPCLRATEHRRYVVDTTPCLFNDTQGSPHVDPAPVPTAVQHPRYVVHATAFMFDHIRHHHTCIPHQCLQRQHTEDIRYTPRRFPLTTHNMVAKRQVHASPMSTAAEHRINSVHATALLLHDTQHHHTIIPHPCSPSGETSKTHAAGPHVSPPRPGILGSLPYTRCPASSLFASRSRGISSPAPP